MDKKKNRPRIVQLDHKLSRFLLPEDDSIEMYSHRTAKKEVADKIVSNGFIFNESFQKTTDQIIDDIVHMRYWDALRKHYGEYVIVLGIAKKVFIRVLGKLKTKYEVQQALSQLIKEKNHYAENEYVYLLPKQYVKGYINRDTGDVVENNEYNPEFIPESLDENIEFLNNH